MRVLKILVINAGSSTIKYQLIDMTDEKVIGKGLAERIGIEGSRLKHKTGAQEFIIEEPMPDHRAAIQIVLRALTERGVINSMSEIGAVGHRVVHGGEKFAKSVLINDQVMAAIRDNIDLAPLHNPANIQGIEACSAIMPKVPMVAVFDTAFHQTMPEQAYLYGIPYELYEKYRVRRYGFHGTSHFYVSRRAAHMMGRPVEDLKIVTCHLGNGCSIAAVDHGKSVDTSMGLTPLEGVMMGTRSGDIDPAILEYLMKKLGLSIEQVLDLLNKKSGLLGLDGRSSDMRDITHDALKDDKSCLNADPGAGDKRANIALNVFAYRVRKYIGAYAAAMGGLDAIAFAGGIGENTEISRQQIVEPLAFLGAELDVEKNWQNNRKESIISRPGSRVTVMIVNTDEEMTIARDTLALSK